jgi:hypothetical protein
MTCAKAENEASEVARILAAAERAVPETLLDPAEWAGEYEIELEPAFGRAERQGEYEPELGPDTKAEMDPAHDQWLTIRTTPSSEVAAALQRRYPYEELAKLLEDPCLWNLACGAVNAGQAILEMHRNDPPPPAEKSRRYIEGAMRREAEIVLSTDPAARPSAIRRARQTLERFIFQGLAAHELDAFICRLEANDGC